MLGSSWQPVKSTPLGSICLPFLDLWEVGRPPPTCLERTLARVSSEAAGESRTSRQGRRTDKSWKYNISDSQVVSLSPSQLQLDYLHDLIQLQTKERLSGEYVVRGLYIH